MTKGKEVYEMIYVTGDTHGLYDFEKLISFSCETRGLSKSDYVIVCGDFGGVWGADTEKTLDFFEALPFGILFADGNHEDYGRMAGYDMTEWNGGKVQIIRPDIIHLMRGQVYTLCERKIFVFGGAESHDKEYRIPGLSWWREELPDAADIAEAHRNLDLHGWNVDYVITHSCDSYTLEKLPVDADRKTEMRESTILCEFENRLTYNHWYFGHYHADCDINQNKTLLYNRVVPLGCGIK